MYAFPDTALALMDVISSAMPEAASVYLWQQADAFNPDSLPAVQIEMLPGAQFGPERTETAVLTVWTTGDVQQASGLMRTLLARILERAHDTPHGLLDLIVSSQTEAPEPSGSQDLARYTATVDIDTRATAVAPL